MSADLEPPNLKGLSMHYLEHVLLDEVKDSGLDVNTVNIYDLVPLIRRKGAKLICPRDGKLGTAYDDCIEGEDMVGPANVFLSYTWAYNIKDIVETMHDQCIAEGRNLKRTYISMCCFHNNQHRFSEVEASSYNDYDKFYGTLNDTITAVGTVWSMMYPWDKPIYVTRAWCMLELYVANDIKEVTLKIIMPEREKKKVMKALGDIKNVVSGALSNYKIENADSTRPEDKKEIFAYIANGVGYTEFNKIVHGLLRKFILSVLDSVLDVEGEDTSPEWYLLRDLLRDLNDDHLQSKIGGGTYLSSDDIDGEDQMKVEVVAQALACSLASKTLKPPFVLGILGKWGSGKSFFFNLIKKHLIKIQRDGELTPEDSPYMGHMYCIKFDAWTYSKDCLWSSLMFRIFSDLSEQLELESAVRKNGGHHSVIELVDKLTQSEQKYLRESNENDLFVRSVLERFKHKNAGASKSFSDVFASQRDKDMAELEETEKMLRVGSWNEVTENRRARNILKDAVLTQLKKATGERFHDLEIKKRTLEENFQQMNWLARLCIHCQCAPILVFSALIVLIVVAIALSIIWERVESIFYTTLSAIVGLGIFLVPLVDFSKRAKRKITELSDEFEDELKAVQHTKSDCEAAYENSNRQHIERERKKINEISRRIRILEGDSMHDFVQRRVGSNVYVERLGIVHQASEDLERLSECMYNKYNSERRERESKLLVRYSNTTRAPDLDRRILASGSNSTVPVLIYKGRMSIHTYWTYYDINDEGEVAGISIIATDGSNSTFKYKKISSGKSYNLHSPLMDIIVDSDTYADTENLEFVFTNDKVTFRLKFSDIENMSNTNEAAQIEKGTVLGSCFRIICNLRLWTNHAPAMKKKNTEDIVNYRESREEVFPGGEPRIVLFVDDLDRCEPDKVVLVLEALQLLVKTKLFVVVLAIDPSYVCLCLETKKYRNILSANRCPTGMEYCEKIMQVSYRLPTMDKEDLGNFMFKQAMSDKRTEKQQKPAKTSVGALLGTMEENRAIIGHRSDKNVTFDKELVALKDLGKKTIIKEQRSDKNDIINGEAGVGGDVSVSVGSSSGGNGGSMSMISGSGSSTGGEVCMTGGTGSSGLGGSINIASGAGTSTSSGSVGMSSADAGSSGVSGSMALSTGATSNGLMSTGIGGSGVGGDFSIEDGSGDSGTGGGVMVTSGSSSGSAGGTMSLKSLSKKDCDLLKRACASFILTPRAAKRIVNVFRILKNISCVQMEDDDHLEHNLLLLVMGSSERTKAGIQSIFEYMERGELPRRDANKITVTNLRDLVVSECQLSERFNAAICSLRIYDKIDQEERWENVSRHFLFARSFTLFRSGSADIHMPELPE